MTKLLGKDIEPNCVYCKNGTPTSDGEKVLCLKKGVMSPGDKCRKFTYDALKRIPRRVKPMDGFTAEDFEL